MRDATTIVDHFKGRIAKSLDLARSYGADTYARKSWVNHAIQLYRQAALEVIKSGATIVHIEALDTIRSEIDRMLP